MENVLFTVELSNGTQEIERQYENVSYKLENYGNFQNVHKHFFFFPFFETENVD